MGALTLVKAVAQGCPHLGGPLPPPFNEKSEAQKHRG